MKQKQQPELSAEEKARLARNAYMREYNSQNREKARAAQIKHWARVYDNAQMKKEG